MTPAQAFSWIADLLGITVAQAQEFCNRLMPVIVGRTVNDSTFWRVTPPAQANTLNTGTRVLTTLLNQMDTRITGMQLVVNSFEDMFTSVVGDRLTADVEAYEEVKETFGNVLRAIVQLKNDIAGGGGLSDEDRAKLDLLKGIYEIFVPTEAQLRVMNARAMTDEEIDDVFEEVFGS